MSFGSKTANNNPSIEPFFQNTNALLGVAQGTGNAQLLEQLHEFLKPYESDIQRLPRSARELLDAQRTARAVLEQTGAYDVVYQWYPTFKHPYGEDIKHHLSDYKRTVLDTAQAYRWLEHVDTVLECGCGAASLGLALASEHGRWIATDIVKPPAFQQLVKELNPGPSLEFQRVDGITLEGIPDNSVDVVLSRSFFEHLLIPDAERHLISVHRVLRPGGRLFLACPAGVGPHSDITNRFPEFDKPQGFHIREWRVPEINEALVEASFETARFRFLRSRWLNVLPRYLLKHNFLPVGGAQFLEAIANTTWRAIRQRPSIHWAWSKLFGHLGAASINVIASKAAIPTRPPR